MSAISGLFGKKKKQEKNAGGKEKALQTIQNLDQQIKDLEAKIDFNDKKANGLQEEAKAFLKKGDKNSAKRCLAKKKRYVDQIKQLEGAMNMMEEQKMMLESADTMKNVFSTIKNTNTVIKEANQGMSIEEMEKAKEEMDDIKDAQNEMNEFFTNYNQEGTEEIEDELGELEKQMAEEEAGVLPQAHKEVIEQPAVAEKNNEEKALEDFLL